jgi:PPOX class probable F420-dependent enzyme
MDAVEMRRRIRTAKVARLATIREEGSPHVVPICFALDGDTLFFAVDAKPKRTADLQRLRNIASNRTVSILVDHYEDDWQKLWWVRLDGTARVVTHETEAQGMIDALVERYPQYRRARPAGPIVAVSIERMTGWAATESTA